MSITILLSLDTIITLQSVASESPSDLFSGFNLHSNCLAGAKDTGCVLRSHLI